MMPILVPFLVRRSVRATTVPATRPAPAPFFHRAGEFRPRLHAQPLERRRIIVERMAGEEKADRFVFPLQALRRQPRFEHRQRHRRRRGAAEQFVLAARFVVMGALRRREHDIDGRKTARAVRLEAIERAGGGEAFEHALVDGARTDAAAEIGEVGEGASPRAARRLWTACRPTPRKAASA